MHGGEVGQAWRWALCLLLVAAVLALPDAAAWAQASADWGDMEETGFGFAEAAIVLVVIAIVAAVAYAIYAVVGRGEGGVGVVTIGLLAVILVGGIIVLGLVASLRDAIRA